MAIKVTCSIITNMAIKVTCSIKTNKQ
jgi:hypothetical protein